MDNEHHTQPIHQLPVIEPIELVQYFQELPLFNTATTRTPTVKVYSALLGEDLWVTPEEAKDFQAINSLL